MADAAAGIIFSHQGVGNLLEWSAAADLASRQRMEEEVDFLNGIIWWKVTQQQKSTFFGFEMLEGKTGFQIFRKDLGPGFWILDILMWLEQLWSFSKDAL